jgi:hypothetical protein
VIAETIMRWPQYDFHNPDDDATEERHAIDLTKATNWIRALKLEKKKWNSPGSPGTSNRDSLKRDGNGCSGTLDILGMAMEGRHDGVAASENRSGRNHGRTTYL